ncbi:MAG: hypothetical protein BWY64_00777 [bacterium ADurb.Bin363]|nr:MAG: hypothetical protein BWY64_00777 [bacterium ADurb.Bin363]
MDLNESEKTLAKETGIEEDILLILKKENDSELKKLESPEIYDIKGNKIRESLAGIYFKYKDYESSKSLVYNLRKKLAPSGYIPFICEMDFLSNKRNCNIGVFRAKDIFEVINLMETNGINYEVTTEEVIERLKYWEGLCSFQVIGIHPTWLDIDFITLPDDLKSFAEDIYEFCPDTLDQGYLGPLLEEDSDWDDFDEAFDSQTTEDLANFLERNRAIFLWWD